MKLSRWLVFISLLIPFSTALAGPAENIVQMMQTFQKNLGPVYNLVVATAYVMGIWFIADSIFRLKKYGQQRTMMSSNASMAKPLVLMAIGIGLIYFPTFINVSIQSLWAYGSSNSIISWYSGSSGWNAFINPIIYTTRLFGLIAVVRGLVILTKLAGESPQPGSMGKGLMHIIAGTFLVNIVGTINVIRATFGF